MLGLAGVVAEGFDKLEILARAGTGDLEEHAKTLPAHQGMSNMATKQPTCHYTTFWKIALKPAWLRGQLLENGRFWARTVELGSPYASLDIQYGSRHDAKMIIIFQQRS